MRFISFCKVVICHLPDVDYATFMCSKFNVCTRRIVMCYEFVPRKEALKDELKQRKERISMSRRVKAWILKARNALMANKRKHPEVETQTPSKVREWLAG
jgi:hypothetical protein